METRVKFISDKYGNYMDNYYHDNYELLLNNLLLKVEFECKVNLGVTNGVIVENNFSGDFSKVNCAIIEHETQGTHVYKILKKTFIKRNLYRVTLIKDIVSSNYDTILRSPITVSRLGLNRSIFNPLLFQKEVMELSEVKTEQRLLGELGGVKSYGYVAIWARESLNGTDVEWVSTPRKAVDYDLAVDSIEDMPVLKLKRKVNSARGSSFVVSRRSGSVGNNISFVVSKQNNNDAEGSYEVTELNLQQADVVTDGVIALNEALKRYKDSLTLEDFNDYGDIGQLNGKTVYERNSGRLYEMNLTSKNRSKRSYYTEDELRLIMGTSIVSYKENVFQIYSETCEYYELSLLSEIPTITKKLSSYSNAIDQPFQLFYIPIIEGANILYENERYISDKLITESMLYDLISKYSGTAGKLLDVQVLTYAPIEGFNANWNSRDLTFDAKGARDVITIDKVIIPLYEVLYTSYKSSVSFNEIIVTDYKIEQTKKYLLTSPSGASNYEFSVAKNKGLTGLNVSVDIRPYSSFHRIVPLYKELYGGNYSDTRGLIYQEDMSLTVTTSAWETYKRQNVNYLASFNAEQDYKRSQLSINQEANWGNYGFDSSKRLIQAGVEAATFAATAVAQDAWFGVKGAISGGVGAAAIMGGAVVGEAIEAGQLAYNNAMDKKLLALNIEYARQQFNYNIGNIKAIPENVEKVSGIFTVNNLVPYLQVFAPTPNEVIYFNNYLDLYGVNIGMILYLEGVSFNYLQGTIVKLAVSLPNEEYEELQAQLMRGIRKIEFNDEGRKVNNGWKL